ncbi:hypothetical protein NMYAN_240003 [Nitrosomonas nitrosa]|uniref:Uncharacterized protein n=1 Tax=Nitrosomonas nitrosa TaxID=52442 RepID=A0A8H8Z060_9PROT|nr:hypothetical protein NMYAN_240003 [Nitrosomonas nitrosa]
MSDDAGLKQRHISVQQLDCVARLLNCRLSILQKLKLYWIPAELYTMHGALQKIKMYVKIFALSFAE